MSGTALYATRALAKARMDLPEASTAFDEMIDSLLELASRKIDDYCHVTHGHFCSGAATEERHYTAHDNDCLYVDPLVSVTSLRTDDGGNRTYSATWATTDYDLLPYNAALEDRPYTRIEVVSSGTHSFPVGTPRGVKISGIFGYSAATPPQIREACLLLLSRWKARQSSPFATLGSAEVGIFRISAIDPDIAETLDVYRTRTIR